MPKRTPKYVPATRKVGEFLLDRLQQHGVQHIFGIPGDYVLGFDKLIENHAIQFINATRENTAGYMADAYARLRGLGAVCITYGVGINISNAISQAFVESSPVVLISGAPGTNDFSRSYNLHHLLNHPFEEPLKNTQFEIFKHITVAQAIINQEETAAAEIDRVLEAALQYKKPVYIELPRNIVNQQILVPHKPLLTEFKGDPHVLAEAIAEVHALLQSSKQPVLWLGHEIQRYGLESAVLQFAERYRIPIVSSLLGKTVISEHHPLFVGVYQGNMSRPDVREFMNNCDCIITLGAILSDLDTGMFTARLNKDDHIVANSNHVKINNHYYLDISFSEFVQALGEIKIKAHFKTSFPANINRKKAEFHPKRGKKITTARMFACIQKHLKPENIIVTDIGDCLFGSSDFSLEKDSFLSCAYFGSLGFGTPGAVGAQIARPTHRVIGIIGDGAFQMTSMELSTAVRYGLAPIIIVLNNHGYGTERPLLEGAYNDIVDWKYYEIPRVLGGGVGIRTLYEEEFDWALQEALSRRDVFTLIEVELGKTDFSPGMQRFLKVVTQSRK